MSNGWSWLVVPAATSLSAVAYATAFPPSAQRWLAGFALVPWLLVLPRTSAWGAVGAAWWWAVLASYALNDWFPRAVAVYFDQPPLIGLGLFLAVASGTAAPFFIVFALWYRALSIAAAPPSPLLVAAGWVAAEWARTELGRDPWALLGYAVPAGSLLAQGADLGGVYLVAFVLSALNAAVTTLVEARMCPGHRRRAGRAAVTVAALLVLASAYGAWRVRKLDAPAHVPVAVVQGNLDIGAQWRPDLHGRNLEEYLALTRAALESATPPQLVIWPEAAMTFFVEREVAYRAWIAYALRSYDAELLAGGPREDADGFRNAAFLIGPDGRVRGHYDKHQLLPFAEYFPIGIDLLRRNFGRVREFVPGEQTDPLQTRRAMAGMLICNEGMFPQPAAERVRDGATVLVQLANDSWLNDPKFAEPAFEMAAMRAVEQRRWLVRASTAGPSAIVAPTGAIVERSGLGTAQIVQGLIAPQSGKTVYAMLGDAFPMGCLIVATWALVRRARGCSSHTVAAGRRWST